MLRVNDGAKLWISFKLLSKQFLHHLTQDVQHANLRHTAGGPYMSSEESAK